MGSAPSGPTTGSSNSLYHRLNVVRFRREEVVISDIIGCEMIEEIKRKLAPAVERKITSEEEVVYILVEVRKILETDPPTGDYYALRFYCDWPVHRIVCWIKKEPRRSCVVSMPIKLLSILTQP